MLTFVCWRWKRPGYRSQFCPNTVRVLRNMIRRHYAKPHRFLCVTDDAASIDSDIDTVPLWDDYRELPAPQGAKNPSCYVRLKAYSAEIESVFGKRFVSIDLDSLIVNDIAPLFDRDDDFVIWGDTNRNTHYNGGLVLMNAGARRKVWDTFDPTTSPQKAAAAQCFGSDQAWISYCLGKGETKWTKADGVYSYRNDLQGVGELPQNARLISFHGEFDPWHPRVQRLAWVRENWQ